MDSNTSANIQIPNINILECVRMHENTSAKPHLENIEARVTNFKHVGDSSNALEHVCQASLGMY